MLLRHASLSSNWLLFGLLLLLLKLRCNILLDQGHLRLLRYFSLLELGWVVLAAAEQHRMLHAVIQVGAAFLVWML